MGDGDEADGEDAGTQAEEGGEAGAGDDEADAGAQAEAGGGDGPGDVATPSGPFPGGRIVAVGDGDFLEDRFAQANSQNVIFAANAVDWLAQDEALIGIRSKDRTPPALAFESDNGRDALKWGSLVGVPLAFMLFGLVRVRGRATRAERRWNEGAPTGDGAAAGDGAGEEGGR